MLPSAILRIKVLTLSRSEFVSVAHHQVFEVHGDRFIAFLIRPAFQVDEPQQGVVAFS
jgi:hypothetical protein